MKVLLVLLACVLVVSHAVQLSPLTPRQRRVLAKKLQITRLEEQSPLGKVGLDLCPTCVSFTEEAIDILLDILLNVGIVDSCGVLCTILEQKTGSQALGAVCNILCDVVGIDEFVKFIKMEDMDPIYFCELTKMCPIFDNGDATITELAVQPESGPQGDRAIMFTFVSKNGTGTGQINVNFTTVDGFPLASSFLSEKQAAGTYPAAIKFSAQKSPNCHPKKDPCETWKHGKYTVTLSICNGECFSAHPHSKVYDRKSANFTITKQ